MFENLTMAELTEARQLADVDVAANWTSFNKTPTSHDYLTILARCIVALRRCRV